MTSTASLTTYTNENMKEDEISPPKNGQNIQAVNDTKRMYQEFTKIVLKVKFEKIHNTHSGQDISEKVLYKECMRQNIPKSEWRDFVINELKQPQKYINSLPKNVKKKSTRLQLR